MVISRSGRQETTRRTWTLCRWELLVGLSELPRSGRTHRESPCPKAKQEGVKMEPKSLERRFRVWSGQPALVNRERHKLSNTHHPCRVSLSCRTCPAEAGITEYFGVSLLGIYLFLHLSGPRRSSQANNNRNGNKSTSCIWTSPRVKTNHDVAAQP